MNFVNTERDTTATGKGTAGFRATWACTPDRAHIGKVQTSSGKWPPTRGAQSTEYLFKVETYSGLEAFHEDFKKRLPAGHFTLIAGEPRPSLKGKQARRQVNLTDAASTRFTIDFDGLAPADAKTPIDSMGAYAEEVILVALDRLPEAFRQAKCMIAATSSTGLRTVSTGLPSEGKARFRATWELTRPITCAQKKRLAKAIDALPGFACIDGNFYSPEHFEFVARPLFLKSETDPIPASVSAYMIDGDLLDVEALCAQLKLDLDKPESSKPEGVRNGEAPPGTAGSQETPEASQKAAEKPQEFRQDLVLDLPPEQAEPLLRALMAAIGNKDGLRDDYNEWFGMVAALFNASKGTAWGLDIAVEWTASGEYPTQEVNEKWKHLTRNGDARQGIDNLIRLAVPLANEAKARAKIETEAGKTAKADVLAAKAAKLETAVSGIERALKATATFPEDIDSLGLPDEDDDDTRVIDEELLALKIPAIDEKAFYGPLKEIVEAATENSEATKIGVAVQVISQVSLCLRPFCIPMAKGPLGLNMFLLQIGPSSKGRKGTSSAFADNFMGPSVRALAQAIRQQADRLGLEQQAKKDACEFTQEAKRNIDALRALNKRDLADAVALVTELKTEKAEAEKQLAAWKTKSTRGTYAPRTQKSYAQAIRQNETLVEDLGQRIVKTETEQARIEAVLADRSTALKKAGDILAQAKAAEKAIAEPAPTEPWRELFMALESPPIEMTGVSSGEGIIHNIRDARAPDGTRDDKGDRGIAEKRLFINLSEFGGVLAQVRRSGSILSSTIRDAWDCKTMMNGSKNRPDRVQEPYVCFSASITPSEFVRLMFDDRDMTTADNGFASRFFTVYVVREKLVACPLPAKRREQLSRQVAENILKVYSEIKPEAPFRSEMAALDFTAGAKKLYEPTKTGIYAQIEEISGASHKSSKLLTRLAPNFRKLSAILAAINGESRVSIGAVEAAYAWVKYAEASANTIAASALDRRHHVRLKENAAAVLKALQTLDAGGGAQHAAREVRRAAHLDAKPFKAAVRFLINRSPPVIEIVEEDWVSGNNTVRKRSLLRLAPPPKTTFSAAREEEKAPGSTSEERDERI